jgi:hypothetical protein
LTKVFEQEGQTDNEHLTGKFCGYGRLEQCIMLIVANSIESHLCSEAEAEAVGKASGGVVKHACAVNLAKKLLCRCLVLCTHRTRVRTWDPISTAKLI